MAAPETETVDPEAKANVGSYYGLFALLVALMLVTVGVSFTDWPGGTRLVINLLLAGVSASVLALFFMHLKESDHLTWLVAAAALFWLAILFVMILQDYLTRHWAVI
jgi:cytochrome c oxidase subunit 4